MAEKKNHALENYKPKTGTDIGQNWVTMSNALTRASHGLTLPEKRIVATVVSKIDSRQWYSKNEVPKVRITAKEYAELYDLDLSEAYKSLKLASDKLYDRSIVFRETAPSRNKSGNKPNEIVMRMRWIGSQKYHVGEGWVELAIWPELLPHLTAIKKQFTTYKLLQVARLRSMYSWRLLELLSTYKRTGEAIIELSDFHHSMETPEAYKANFANLRRYVIEPAIKELSIKDNWSIEWEAIKRGRKVHQIRFKFDRDTQMNLGLDG